MKADTWMPLYIADYLRDTMRLSTVQHGAYFLLLMACWTEGGSLADDNEELAAITKMAIPDWKKARRVLERFFVVEGGAWSHKRVSAELDKARRLSETRREQGSKGGRPKKQTESNEKPIGLANGNQNGLQTETPALVAPPSPLPVPSEPMEATASLSTAVDESELSAPAYPKPFEAAWKAYPHTRGRSSKPKALGFWRRLAPAIRAALPAAAARYALEGREPRQDCGAPGMHLWLRDEKFADWIVPEPAKAPSAAPAPDERWRHACRRFLASGYWDTTRDGLAKPGKPGCQVPPAILAEFGLAPAEGELFPAAPPRSAA